MYTLYKDNFYCFNKFIFLLIYIYIIFSISPACLWAQTQVVSAPEMLNLPSPGKMVQLSSDFVPTVLTGIKVYPDNPFRFDFIMDAGEEDVHDEALAAEGETLINYFLTALTVPEDDLWVNLSPYEQDRIIPEKFGHTDMGRDLLAQDYVLKQLTSSLMHPDSALGQRFWDKVYEKARKKYGSLDIPLSTFHKIWIVPRKAVVYEQGHSAFVVETHLKVMLEEDYLALRHTRGEKMTDRTGPVADSGPVLAGEARKQSMPPEASNAIKEILIPEIEKEVNEGKTFSRLRKIFHSMVLATWFKRKLKNSILGKTYVGQNKVVGIDIADKEVKQKIYGQYLEAFRVGVFDCIREDYDVQTQELIPRRYFSGGIQGMTSFHDSAMLIVNDEASRSLVQSRFIRPYVLSTDLTIAQERLGDRFLKMQELLARFVQLNFQNNWNDFFDYLEQQQSAEDAGLKEPLLRSLENIGLSGEDIQSVRTGIVFVNERARRLNRGEDEIGGIIVRHKADFKMLLPRYSYQDSGSMNDFIHFFHEVVEILLLNTGVTYDVAHQEALALNEGIGESENFAAVLAKAREVVAAVKMNLSENRYALRDVSLDVDGLIGSSMTRRDFLKWGSIFTAGALFSIPFIEQILVRNKTSSVKISEAFINNFVRRRLQTGAFFESYLTKNFSDQVDVEGLKWKQFKHALDISDWMQAAILMDDVIPVKVKDDENIAWLFQGLSAVKDVLRFHNPYSNSYDQEGGWYYGKTPLITKNIVPVKYHDDVQRLHDSQHIFGFLDAFNNIFQEPAYLRNGAPVYSGQEHHWAYLAWKKAENDGFLPLADRTDASQKTQKTVLVRWDAHPDMGATLSGDKLLKWLNTIRSQKFQDVSLAESAADDMTLSDFTTPAIWEGLVDKLIFVFPYDFLNEEARDYYWPAVEESSGELEIGIYEKDGKSTLGYWSDHPNLSGRGGFLTEEEWEQAKPRYTRKIEVQYVSPDRIASQPQKYIQGDDFVIFDHDLDDLGTRNPNDIDVYPNYALTESQFNQSLEYKARFFNQVQEQIAVAGLYLSPNYSRKIYERQLLARMLDIILPSDDRGSYTSPWAEDELANLKLVGQATIAKNQAVDADSAMLTPVGGIDLDARN